MAPFSMRCQTCGEFIYKGKKFNARKENTEEFYLTIRILRFYIRCPKCASEITFKTDPQNTDYQAEHGATRNYEPWKEEREQDLKRKREREQEESLNPLKALENKTLDSKKELEVFEALDEIRALNDRNYRLDPETVMHLLRRDGEENEEEVEESFDKEQQAFLQQQPKEDDETAAFIKGLFNRKNEPKLSQNEPKFSQNEPKFSQNQEDASDTKGKISIGEPSKPIEACSHGLLASSTTAGFTIPGIVVKKRRSAQSDKSLQWGAVKDN